MTQFLADASAEGASSASLNLTLLLAMQVAMQPKRAFLADPGRPGWSFQEAEAAAAHVADFLTDVRVMGGERIGLMTPNSCEAVVAFLGALRAGLQPVILPPVLGFDDLIRAVSTTRPAAIIAQPSGGVGSVETAMRLAAAQSSIRFVMGISPSLPRGVIDLGQRIEKARLTAEPARDDDVREADAALAAGAGGKLDAIVFEPLISAAADIVRLTGLRSADRVVTPYTLGDGGGLASGLIAVLFAGAELALLDAPDSVAVRAALSTERPRHLVWPMRHAALARDLLNSQSPLRSLMRRIHGNWRDLQIGRDIDLGADAVVDIMTGEDSGLIVAEKDDPAAQVALARSMR